MKLWQKELCMSLETDTSAIVFRICSTSINGKTSITCQSRLFAGEPLKVVSNDDVSDDQLYAICKVLDELP